MHQLKIKFIQSIIWWMLSSSVITNSVHAWSEHTGSGTVNGIEFPIAVLRGVGSNEQFFAMLKERFGKEVHINAIPTANGTQFFVQIFDPKSLTTLPFNRSSTALEQYILSNTMAFTLFHIDGDSFAVGSPMAVFGKVAAGDIKGTEFLPFKNDVTSAMEISFKFGNIEIHSLHATVTSNPTDLRTKIRESFEATGLKPAQQQMELSIITNDNPYEFYLDGKSSVANFALITDPATKEVTINVNQIKIR